MNALELADILDRSVLALSADAAAELRRLYEVNQELLLMLKWMASSYEKDAKYARIAINKAEGRA